MPIIRCPSCDDRVEIEDDWYGRRIACPSCDKTFTPERERGGGDRPRRAADAGDRDDDRPRRSRSRSRYDDDPPKSGGGLKWVLISLAVFGLLVCGGCVGVVVWVMNAKESFSGQWADHSAGVNGEVTASFPKPPTRKYPSVSASTDGHVVGYDNTVDGGGLDAIFAVGYFDFPAGTDPLGSRFDDIRKAVEEEFNVAPVIKADIVGDRKMTVGGHPAREVTYSKEDGGYTLQVVHVANGKGNGPVRAVVVFAGGMNMQDADKQKFLNSVKIGGKK